MATKNRKPSKLSYGRSMLMLSSGCWLVSRQVAEDLSKRAVALTTRLFGPGAADDDDDDDDTLCPAPSLLEYAKRDGVATIPVVGVLTKYSLGDGWIDDWFGLAPTLSIRTYLDNAIADPEVRSIVLLFDTPGGDANGTYELAEAIAAADKVKPVYAVVSDTCTSGGQLLASQCRSIRANDKAWLGCIGVYRILCDDSKFWADMGISWTVVSSGGIKGAGNDGKVSQELIDDQQREVNDVYELFITYVATGRGMSTEAVRKIADGKSYIAAEAKTLGLLDEVASIDASMAAILEETTAMTEQEFQTYAKANPNSTKAFRDEGFTDGKTAGVTEGAQQQRERFDKLNAKFGKDRPTFVCEQFAKGNNVDQAAVELADVVLAENAQLKEQLAKGGGKVDKSKQQQQQQQQQQDRTTPPPIADDSREQDEQASPAAAGAAVGKSFRERLQRSRGLKPTAAE